MKKLSEVITVPRVVGTSIMMAILAVAYANKDRIAGVLEQLDEAAEQQHDSEGNRIADGPIEYFEQGWRKVFY